CLRADRSRLDRLPERSAQGPQHQRGVGLVHRHLRRRLRRLLRHRSGAAPALRGQPPVHMAGGGAWPRHSAHSRHPDDPLSLMIHGEGDRSMKSLKPLWLTGPVFLAGLSAAPAQASGLTVTVEIPRLGVSEYHRPYVAMWIEGGGLAR